MRSKVDPTDSRVNPKYLRDRLSARTKGTTIPNQFNRKRFSHLGKLARYEDLAQAIQPLVPILIYVHPELTWAVAIAEVAMRVAPLLLAE